MNVLEKWKSPALFNCFRSTAKKKERNGRNTIIVQREL